MACAGRSAHVRPHRCLGSRGRRAAFGADGCAGLRVSLLPTNYVASALKPVRVTVIRVKRSARSAELSHEVRRQRRWSLISPCIYRRIPSPAPRAHKRQGYKTCATVKKGHTTTLNPLVHTPHRWQRARVPRRAQGAGRAAGRLVVEHRRLTSLCSHAPSQLRLHALHYKSRAIQAREADVCTPQCGLAEKGVANER